VPLRKLPEGEGGGRGAGGGTMNCLTAVCAVKLWWKPGTDLQERATYVILFVLHHSFPMNVPVGPTPCLIILYPSFRPLPALLELVAGSSVWFLPCLTQAVSRSFPRFELGVRSSGICGGQSGTDTGSRQIFWLPLPLPIQPTAAYSSIIRGRYSRPNSGRRIEWTVSPHPK
jgi:hypothetical protein